MKNRAEAGEKRFPKAVSGLSPADLIPPSTYSGAEEYYRCLLFLRIELNQIIY